MSSASPFDEGFNTFLRCDKRSAINYFTEHLRRYPNDFECWMYRGISYAILGDPNKAETDFIEAENVGKDFQKLIARGLRAKEGGNVAEALRIFRQATETYPTEGIGWHFYGVTLLTLRDKKDEAAAAFQMAIRRNYKRCCTSQYLLGTILASQGKHEEAMAEFRESLRANPSTTVCHIALGDSLAHSGQYDKAAVCYRQATQLNASLLQANLGLGVVMMYQGDEVGALEEVRTFMTSLNRDVAQLMTIQSPLPTHPVVEVVEKEGAHGMASVDEKVTETGSHLAAGSKPDSELAADGEIQMATCGEQGKLYSWATSPRLWFSIDRSNHAGVQFVAYEDKGDRLECLISINEIGRLMPRKPVIMKQDLALKL